MTTPVTGSIAATGAGSVASLWGQFNLSLSGTWVGTAKLQRSFDGSTWLDVESFTANVEKIGEEPEPQVSYRVHFTRTSGTLVYRLSR